MTTHPSSEQVEIHGHIMDSGILSPILDDIREYGGDHEIERIDVGRGPIERVVRPHHRQRPR